MRGQGPRPGHELAKKSPSKADKRARDQALIKIEKGEIAGAVVWARKYRIHDSMQVSQAPEVVEISHAADQYSNYYTNLYGVLAWRPRSDFTTDDDNGRAGTCSMTFTSKAAPCSTRCSRRQKP